MQSILPLMLQTSESQTNFLLEMFLQALQHTFVTSTSEITQHDQKKPEKQEHKIEMSWCNRERKDTHRKEFFTAWADVDMEK